MNNHNRQLLARIAYTHPEMPVLDLVRQTVGTARKALAMLRPEPTTHGDLGRVDDEGHYALLLFSAMLELDRLILRYRAAVEKVLAEDDDDLNDIPY